MLSLLSSRLPLLLLASFALDYLASIPAVYAADEPQDVVSSQPHYQVGDRIPVTCLNRTIDSGEHVADSEGRLVYVPFPSCKETRRPLELYFGQEKDMNCTIEFVDDTFFHLLEFYVHSDAPMTCRIPARPFFTPETSSQISESQVGVLGSEDSNFIPLVIVVTGILQRSHLHIANNLNVLVHAAPKAVAPGVIDAAIAYSVSHRTRHTRITIGDSLPLRLNVRWYHTPSLPSGWTGMGGHLFLSTVIYCILSAGGATAICIAYFRGIVLPQRLRSYGRERTFTPGRYTGYGYGIGNGYGYSATGKSD